MSEHVEAEFVEEKPAALAIRPDEPIRALVSPDEARKQWQDYQALKTAIATPDDYQEFQDRKSGKTRRFPKKSFVKKIQTYFGITVQVVSADRDTLPDGHFAFRVVARALAPNGRSVDATGACSTLEERFDINPYRDEAESRFAERQKKALARAYHDVLSTAETRATNRAVMNLIGGGEVTADELSREPRSLGPAQEPAKTMSDAQKAVMFCQRLGVSESDRKSYIKQFYSVESFNDLDKDQLRAVCEHFKALKHEERNAS